MHGFQKEALDIFTHRVFNTRDLDTAMNEVYKFFRRHLHVDFIDLSFYDEQKGAFRYRVIINDEGSILADETIRFSDRAGQSARQIAARKIELIGNTLKNPVTEEISAHMGIKEPGSDIVVSTGMGSSQYGVLSLVAWGENKFTHEHLKMIKDLYEPIAGAARYLLSQLEIVSLKERFIRENEEIRERLLGRRVIGASTGLKEVMALMEQAAPLDVPILIMGETGVGKEVVAHAIHHMSSRADGPMISINCGAIPDTLLDSELFGHEKGAFTGADAMRQGYFEQANRGTIFLDEVSELSLPAQVKLLRVIQEMTFQRVGGKRPISVDVRVIAATNRDLTNLIANLQFRKDLWFRLNVFPVSIPPLRERMIDIPAFAEYFVRRLSIEMNLPYRSRFARGAMEQLQAYDWPGNVRELQNVIERALIASRGEPLSFPNLSSVISGEQGKIALPESSHYLALDEMMAWYIRQTLVKTKGQISGKGGAADLLKVKPSTLRARMRKLGVQVKRQQEVM